MEKPITVKKITFSKEETLQEKMLFGNCGDMVVVRSCADEYDKKTFLGVLLGEIALTVGASFNEKTGELIIDKQMYNPAIFIPSRNKVVYGCGSWWGKIESKKQLCEITDNDIDNVWYVKALKQLSANDG